MGKLAYSWLVYCMIRITEIQNNRNTGPGISEWTLKKKSTAGFYFITTVLK